MVKNGNGDRPDIPEVIVRCDICKQSLRCAKGDEKTILWLHKKIHHPNGK